MKLLALTFFLTGITVSVWGLNKAPSTPSVTVVESQPEQKPQASPSPKVDNNFEADKKIHRISVKEDNTVFIFDEITEDSVNIAQEITEKSKNTKDLYVLINSPGGSVLDGAQIIAAIQASPAKVHTICVQLCASMGAMIHGYGHERHMVDRALLMHHQAALGLQGPIEIVRSRLDTLYRYTQKMDKYIASRAGLSLEEFNKMFSNELWLDSEDATYRKLNESIVHLDYSAFSKDKKDKIENSVQQTKLKLKLGF